MPNRSLHELNNVLRSACDVSTFFQKRYIGARSFCANPAPVPFAPNNLYYQLSGYDLFGTTEENEKSIVDAFSQLVDAIGSAGGHLTLNILIDSNGINVFYGASYLHAPIIKNTLINSLCNPIVSNKWISPQVLAKNQQYGAFIVGSSRTIPFLWDQVLTALDGHQCMITILARTIQQQTIANDINSVNILSEQLQKVEHTESTYGGQRRRTSTTRNMDVADALDVLTSVKKQLLDGLKTHLWETVVYFSAPTEHEFNICSPIVAAAFSSQPDEHGVGIPASIVQCPIALINGAQWIIPCKKREGTNYSAIYSRTLVNTFTSGNLTALVSPPLKEHRGYSINHLGASANVVSPFASFSPSVINGKKFVLGRLQNNEPLLVSLDGLRQHVLVTGETQFGKSTTVKRMICGAWNLGIPFLVLEAAKKDYWKLKLQPGMERVRVYSGGDDGLPLRINPFQPEKNTILEYHIQSLITIMLSLFDSTDPLPQIIQDLVYRTYEKLGWNTKKRVTGTEESRYPTFSDMLENLDECIQEIGYDEETQQRMRGVIFIRLKSIIRQAGDIFNSAADLSIESLYQTSAIIELDDFARDTIPFFASVIALRVNEYAKTQAIEPELRRLLVVEEAHNLLPNPDLPSTSKNQAACAVYFSNMLAEISGYGTGMVIVDQRPSKLASGAIANTGLKVAHHHSEKEDLTVISSAFSFNDSIKEQLRHLRIGQAIISLPNLNGTYLTSITQLPPWDSKKSLGCLFCTKLCCESKTDLIREYDVNRVRSNGSSCNVLLGCINSIINRSLVEVNIDELMCIAGCLCKQAGNEMENSQIIRQQLFELYLFLQNQKEAK